MSLIHRLPVSLLLIPRLPVLEEAKNVIDDNDDDRFSSAGIGGGGAGVGGTAALGRLPRWFTLGHIESKQCELAVEMLNAAKGSSALTHGRNL